MARPAPGHPLASYTFLEINLSSASDASWGPDLLGEDVLEPGDVIDLSGIECDTYDIRIVDDTDDECIREEVDVCLEASVWTIDDAELALCAF